jgi:hypothetical protein
MPARAGAVGAPAPARKPSNLKACDPVGPFAVPVKLEKLARLDGDSVPLPLAE